MSKVIVNDFALRQTANSPFSHFEGSWDEVCSLVEANLHRAKQGYREHVMLVPVPATGFKSGVVQLTEGCEMVATFTARRAGEEPRKTVAAKGGVKSDAAFVEVVCYHSSILDGDAKGEDCWEIISVNASAVENEPIPTETLLYNHFMGSGGTATGYTPEEFIAALHRSWSYWKDKAMYAPAV